MAKNKPYEMSDSEKYAEQRRRSKINVRHNSPTGKARGERKWAKARRRVRRKLLGR